MRPLRPAALLAAALAAAALPAGPSPAGARSRVPPVPFTGDFPDPHVVRAGRAFLAFATNGNGRNVPVLRSTDLRTWRGVGEALPALPSWATPYLWAPGAFRAGGRWRLYFTAHSPARARQCISVAGARRADGPFRDRRRRPLVCQVARGGSIDPFPYRDGRGRAWLLWKSEGHLGGEPTRLWSQRLTRGGVRLAGPRTELLHTALPWEQPVVENPAMIRFRGRTYFFYSASRWDSAAYAIGYAVCRSPRGPCRRPSGAPLLASAGEEIGPGGPSPFVDGARRLRLAYHAWTAPRVGYPGGARSLRLATLRRAGGGRLRVASRDDAARPLPRAVTGLAATPSGRGYLVARAAGGVTAFGDAPRTPPLAARPAGARVAAAVVTPTGGGAWVATADGGVFTSGDAPFLGSAATLPLRAPIVGMAATPTGRGYWLVARDGGVFTFGDARFRGSAGGIALWAPIVGMAATPTGRGYWLVARDGGIFAFGDAGFHGSTGGLPLPAGVVGIAATPAGAGYWILAAHGQVFAFGDAPRLGSAPPERGPYARIAGHPSGAGYWLASTDGSVSGFGAARRYRAA